MERKYFITASDTFAGSLYFEDLRTLLNSWTFKEYDLVKKTYEGQARRYRERFPHILNKCRYEAGRRRMSYKFVRRLKPGDKFALEGRTATVTEVVLGDDGIHDGALHVTTDLGEELVLKWRKKVPKIYM